MLSPRAKLSRYFGRGIFTTFLSKKQNQRQNRRVILANDTCTLSLFTVEIYSEVIFLDEKVNESNRFNRESTLDVRTHNKDTETFEYFNF